MISLRDQSMTLEKINRRSEYYMDEIEKAAEISRNKKVRTKKRHADAYYESYRDERNSMKSIYACERNAILKMGVKWDNDHRFYFKEHLKSKCIVEGGSVYLNCYVAGIPPFVTSWFKDGVPLCRDEYEKYFIRVCCINTCRGAEDSANDTNVSIISRDSSQPIITKPPAADGVF